MRCLVTGVVGQDGNILSELLMQQGHEVFGMVHQQKVSSIPFANLVRGDLTDATSIFKLVQEIKPDEIYNMGAFTHAGFSFDQPVKTALVNGLGPVHVYEAARRFAPHCHIYQASTSELFGTLDGPANEQTEFKPENPYGVAKLYAHKMAALYRRMGVWVTCGILFNHTSPRQGTEFLLPKLIATAEAIIEERYHPYNVNGAARPFVFSNEEQLRPRRDIGWAQEYCEGIIKMVRLSEPTDMVLGTGVTCSVRELAEAVFSQYDIPEWREIVRHDNGGAKDIIRPIEVQNLQADSSKAKRLIGWNPKWTWRGIVKLAIDIRHGQPDMVAWTGGQ